MKRAVATVAIVILMTTGGYLYGQQQVQPYQPQAPMPPNVRTGADIGFRMDRMEGNRALVTLMIRSKSGEWIEAWLSPGQMRVLPLESK